MRKMIIYFVELLKIFGIGIYKVSNIAFEDQKNALSDSNEEIVIFDIGSNEGQVVEKYKTLFPKSKIFSFEPIIDLFELQKVKFQKDSNINIYQTIISEIDGTITLNINNVNATSSILKPNIAILPKKYLSVYDIKENIKVKSEKIDTFCKNHEIEKINILKLDVQGAELKVLQGAKEMLLNHNIDIIFLECAFVELYENQCMFDDIVVYLTNLSYKLHCIYDMQYNFSSGRVLQCDAIFIANEKYKIFQSHINLIK